jgi:hypothetical protein
MMASPTVIDAAWTFDDQNTSLNGRYMIGGFFTNAASSVNANVAWRDGVLPGPFSSSLGAYRSYHVTENSPTGSSVLVAQGHAIVTRTGQGVYVCPNSQSRVVDLDPADATNPRIDLIVLKVLDQPLGDSVTQAQVLAVTGAPSGSPVVPAVPTGAIPLARVAVAAAPTGDTITNANITDLRKSTSLAGSIRILMPGDAVSDAGSPGNDLRYQAGLFERWTTGGGGRWEPFGKTNIGFGYVDKVTFTSNGGTTSGTTELMMRTATFTCLPNRRYKITARIGLTATTSTYNARLRWAASGTVAISDTQIISERSRIHTTGAFDEKFIIGEFTGPSVAGSVTVGISVEATDGQPTQTIASAENVSYILIEDIGGV